MASDLLKLAGETHLEILREEKTLEDLVIAFMLGLALQNTLQEGADI